MSRVTIPRLHEMKRAGEKIFGVVAWDTHMAAIADRVGVEIVSVGDTVGKNLWGHTNPLEVTMDEMIVVARAVRRGVSRALVSADFPYGPLQEGDRRSAARRHPVRQGGGRRPHQARRRGRLPAGGHRANPGRHPRLGAVRADAADGADAGHPVREPGGRGRGLPDGFADRMVAEALRLEEAGAVLLDFTNSGPEAGRRWSRRSSIPVIGGFGGGPWLDGRVRLAQAAVGYDVAALDAEPKGYANVARVIHDALATCAGDVRGGRQIRGQPGS